MALGVLVILLNAADNLTTYKFIHAAHGNLVVVEGNPVMRYLMDALGVRASLALDMMCLAFLALYLASTRRLSWNVRFWTLVVLALLPLWAVVNNVHVALALDLPIL